MSSSFCRMCTLDFENKELVSMFTTIREDQTCAMVFELLTSQKVEKSEKDFSMICSDCLNVLRDVERLRSNILFNQTCLPNLNNNKSQKKAKNTRDEKRNLPVTLDKIQATVKVRKASTFRQECRVCRVTFTSPYVFSNHFCMSHVLSCNKCDAELTCKCQPPPSPTKKNLLKKIIACDICGQRFSTAKELMTHLNEYAKNDICYCVDCQKIISSRELFNTHLLQVHSDTPLE